MIKNYFAVSLKPPIVYSDRFAVCDNGLDEKLYEKFISENHNIFCNH